MLTPVDRDHASSGRNRDGQAADFGESREPCVLYLALFPRNQRGSRVLWALGPTLSFGWLAIPARRWGYDTCWMDDADRNTAEKSCSHVILSFGESWLIDSLLRVAFVIVSFVVVVVFTFLLIIIFIFTWLFTKPDNSSDRWAIRYFWDGVFRTYSAHTQSYAQFPPAENAQSASVVSHK